MFHRLLILPFALLCTALYAADPESQETESPETELVETGSAEPGSAEAESPEPQSGFSIFLENDSLVLNGQDADRNYTMGMAVQGYGPWIDRYKLNRPRQWLDTLLRVDELHAQEPDGPFVGRELVEFGISAFTPDDLRSSEPQYDDRPYASIVYLTSRNQTVSSDARSAMTSELALGVLGLSIADAVQTSIHEKLQDFPGDTPYSPNGWHLQISDGGEPTFRYSLAWQDLLVDTGYFDLQWIRQANVGYYTNAAVGAAFRVGVIESPWWAFSSAPISESVLALSNARPDEAAPETAESGIVPPPSRRWELYFWAGANARLWLYNAILEGQFRDSVVTVPSSRMERLIGEYQLGITGSFAFRNTWHSITYAYASRNTEFDAPEARSHSWGGIYYNMTWAMD